MNGKEKYIIDYSKSLGRGATAEVFLGMSKEDGTPYALKCSKLALKKEVSVLKELDHKNIVKFYETLSDFENFTQVIVMEYCNKGSLYDLIEMHKGLCDNMFLTTLECLYHGISYLREKIYIHRDIKPGNMMVHLDSMGYCHVKIGDMGTAKKVEDNQTFSTLVGTEEYLHPDMYIRYLEGFHNKTHKASMDLWSIGVTLYHALVTKLPFLPYNYSRASPESKNVLKYMYLNKPPNAISGRQKSNNSNEIEWSYKLPKECRLSSMLKNLASDLIASLMDNSDNNTYERFFDIARKILQKKRTLLFNANNGELQFLYLDSLTYNSIIEESCKLMEVERENVVLVTRNKKLDQLYDQQAEFFESYPVKGHMTYDITDSTVLAVTVRQDENGESNSQLLTMDFRDNIEAPYPRYRNIRETKRYSEELMKDIYRISRNTNYIDCQMKCYKALVSSFNENVIMKTISSQFDVLQWQMKGIRDICLMTENLVAVAKIVIERGQDQSHLESLNKCLEDIEQLRQKANEGERCGEQYYSKIVEKREMIKFSLRALNQDNNDRSVNDSLDNLVHLAEELVHEIQLLPEDRIRNVTEEVYKLEVWQRHIRQFGYYNAAKLKLVAKNKSIKQLHTSYANWLKQSQSVMLRVTQLRDFLKRQEERRLNLRGKYIQIYEFLQQLLQTPGTIDGIRREIPDLNLNNDDVLKTKIMEIKNLTQMTKSKIWND